ncbi:MAG: translation initiation factor IF-1 [Candidatus Magasanikbacteria bacterium]|nr:translation initiation factor IF-1 [Candidatus Magasanikbacteria bacterium]
MGGNKQEEIVSSKDVLELTGVVEELLPSARFKIKLEDGHTIIGYLSGKIRLNRIHILPGDRVKVAMTPYDLTKGRIVYRF